MTNPSKLSFFNSGATVDTLVNMNAPMYLGCRVTGNVFRNAHLSVPRPNKRDGRETDEKIEDTPIVPKNLGESGPLRKWGWFRREIGAPVSVPE